MDTPILKELNDAILESVNWQGLTLASINVSPDTYLAIYDHCLATNSDISCIPEHYKGYKLNVDRDMLEPFSLNASIKVKISVWNDPSAPSMSFDKPKSKYRPNSVVIDDPETPTDSDLPHIAMLIDAIKDARVND